MSADQVLPEPSHRLSQMTTSELAQRRRELEHCRKGLSPDAPYQAELARLLDDVLAEEAERDRIARAGPKHPMGN